MRRRVLLGACWAAIFILLLGMPGRARADALTSVVRKNPAPVVVKEVSPDGETWAKELDASIGQTLWYRITGTLSGNLDDYDAYPYVFVDGYDAALCLHMETLSVSIVSSEEVRDVTDTFEVSETEDGFEVSCVDLKEVLPDLTSHDLVVLTYQAHLTREASLGFSSPNKNACHVNYTQKDGEPASTPDDLAFVYSFAIEVRKVEADSMSPLQGVGFALRDAKGRWFGEGVWDESEDGRRELRTDALGILKFGPVGAGDYQLVETRPLAGYKNVGVLAVQIRRGDRLGLPTLVVSCDGSSVDVDAKEGVVSLLVKNEHGENEVQMTRATSDTERDVRSGLTEVGGVSTRSPSVLAVTGDGRLGDGTFASVALLGILITAMGMVKRREGEGTR